MGDYRRVTDAWGIRVLMLIVFAVTLLDGLDMTTVNIALPTMSEELNITASNSSWVLNAYALGIAAPLLVFVKLADSGRVRSLLIIGLTIFTVSSLFCGLSNNYIMLIFSRLARGVGASMMGATAPVIVVRILPEDMKGRGMAMLSMSMGVSMVLGPMLGGFLLSFASWKWIFLSVIPVGVILITICLLSIPRADNTVGTGFPDIPSVIYTGLVVSLILVILENLVYSTMGLLHMSICCVGCIVFALLLIRRLRMPDINQLVHLEMMMNREFMFVVGAFLLTTMVATGFMYILPFFLQETWAMSEGTSAIYISLMSALSIASSLYAGKWCDIRGCRSAAALAVALRVAFCAALVFMVPEWGIVPLVLVLLIVGLSFGISTVAQNTRIVQHTVSKFQAEASAVMLQIHYISSSLGVVLYAIVLNIVSQGALVSTPEMISTSMHISSFIGAVMCVVALVFTLAVRNVVPSRTQPPGE